MQQEHVDRVSEAAARRGQRGGSSHGTPPPKKSGPMYTNARGLRWEKRGFDTNGNESHFPRVHTPSNRGTGRLFAFQRYIQTTRVSHGPTHSDSRFRAKTPRKRTSAMSISNQVGAIGDLPRTGPGALAGSSVGLGVGVQLRDHLDVAPHGPRQEIRWASNATYLLKHSMGQSDPHIAAPLHRVLWCSDGIAV